MCAHVCAIQEGQRLRVSLSVLLVYGVYLALVFCAVKGENDQGGRGGCMFHSSVYVHVCVCVYVCVRVCQT